MMLFYLKNSFKYFLGFFYKINPIFRISLRQRLTVFVFHEVSDNPSEFTKKYGLSLSVAQFKKHINWINDNFTLINPELLITNDELPNNAALITFDDGFAGAFENAFPILDQLDIPSVMFMNMQPQIERLPLLSALVIFLMDNCQNFQKYVDSLGLTKPAYLSVTPEIIAKFKKDFDLPQISEVIKFQGDLVDSETMKFWDKCHNVYYGNHLYDHWNAAAISQSELKRQYYLNDTALEDYESSIKLFAFTNGKPNTCFSEGDIETIVDMGAKKVFSSVQGCNKSSNSLLLGRVFTSELDVSSNHLWCRVGLSYSEVT